MLNVLSFFFIKQMNTKTIHILVFRCSMFWAFSLYLRNAKKTTVKRSFDAQCFELFLYLSMKLTTRISQKSRFDAQCSELFLYWNHLTPCYDWRCVSMLNVLSFFFMYRSRNSDVKVRRVSMLNFLSFFFMMH